MKNRDIIKELSGLERTVTIVGKSEVRVAVSKIVAVIDIKCEESELILQKSIQEGHFMPFIRDKSKIRSYLLMDNGDLYPSTFRVKTICDRMKEDTGEDK